MNAAVYFGELVKNNKDSHLLLPRTFVDRVDAQLVEFPFLAIGHKLLELLVDFVGNVFTLTNKSDRIALVFIHEPISADQQMGETKEA